MPPLDFARTRGPSAIRATEREIAISTQITLTTKNFDNSRAGLETIRKRHNGYFSQITIASPADASRTLDGVLRVPADHLTAVMSELRQLGRVASESQIADDVTKESVDLDARLTNAHNTEQRLTALLRDRAGSLSDVLAVEKEIDEVRGRIEQMEAQKKTLVNRVDFATIAIKITEERRDFRIVPILGLLVLLAALAYSTRAVLMKSRFGKWFRR